MLPILLNNSYFTVYSYPLFMGLAWGFSYHYTLQLFKANGLIFKKFQWFFLGVFLSAWAGSKLFFLINISNEMTQTYLINSNFWLGGGFVFYGGVIFAVIFTYFYYRFIEKIEIKAIAIIVISICFGHAIGRVGCFLAGCCYGTNTNSILGVHLHGQTVHAVQLYEAFSLILIGFFLKKLLVKKVEAKKVILSYFLIYGVDRFVLEFFRGDSVRGVYNSLSTSQYVSVIMIVVSAILFIKNRSKVRI
ncbi:MAG: prolipoprotein diacylglyceryl transferase family protein [Bacteriovoracaceae bacterium]